MKAAWKRRFLSAVGISVALGGILLPATGASASKAQKITNGGIFTQGMNPGGSFDPASPAISGAPSALWSVYDGLFIPQDYAKNLLPGLALSYTWAKDHKELTLDLRPHVKFQDGTPFNSTAVQFNILRDQQPTSTTAPNLATVTSVKTAGPLVVHIFSSQPDTNLLSVVGNTAVGMIASPTAVNSEGAQFGLKPIGAGPFEVTAFTPSTSATLVAWPGYWDSRNRHLAGVDFLNTGTDPTATIVDLKSNSIQAFETFPVSAPPTVYTQAAADPQLKMVIGARQSYQEIFLNTTKPPFNNIVARQAVAYCLNRPAIAAALTNNLATPAYVMSGNGEEYYPGTAAAKSLEPYQFNEAKGASLVQQIPGGLSFTITTSTNAQTEAITEAEGGMFTACGMKVSYSFVINQFPLYPVGNYQMATQATGGTYNPFLQVSLYSEPSGAYDKFGFNSPTVTNLLNATGGLLSDQTFEKVWKRIFQTMDTLAVNIPVMSYGDLYVENKCLKGLDPWITGFFTDEAYFSCTPQASS
jgi:peptide/nickel transport system substrate-binding protein